MKPFCETIVIEVMPTVRSVLAKKLSGMGMKNKDIASAMGLTPAAVTQYLKKARGSRVETIMKNKKVDSMIGGLACRMAEKKLSPEESIHCFCGICKEIRKQRILCKLHNGPKGCSVCVPTSC